MDPLKSVSNATIETTFVILKPDAVRRALCGAIIERFERAGLKIKAMKMMTAEKSIVEKHYAEHKGKKFYKGLIDLLTSAPIMIIAVQGAHAVRAVRKLVGATEPLEAAPGTIRGDFSHISYDRSQEHLGVIPNLIHASDSKETAIKEIALWFRTEDFPKDYDTDDDLYF